MNDFGDLGDFFSLVGDEKKKNDEKNKELMGEVSLGDLFTSLSEEKKKVVKKRKKKEEELEKLKKEAKIFENLFFDTPQKEINTKDWKDDYTPIEIETEDVITPEPLKPSEPVVEYEELEESVDNKTTIDKSLEILDQIVVEEDKINESETEIARLKREMDQLRKMINETARVASAQGGGGEVRFQYLDDIVGIASNLSSFDGMYLGIDVSNSAQPFKFSSVNTGAGGTWATFDSNTGVTTTKKVKINNDLEVTGVTTSTGGFVGNLTGSATGLTGTPDITVRNVSVTGVSTFSGAATLESTNYLQLKDNTNIIGHNGVNNLFRFTDTLQFRGDTLFFQEYDGTEYMRLSEQFGVQLKHQGSTKLQIESDGITVTGTINDHTIPSGSGTFALTSDVPTNNNELTNGAGYITTSFTNTNQLTNGAGFVTFTNNNQLTNGAGYITTSFTNTNQLTNGAGFVTFTNNNQLTNGAGYITTSFTNTNQLTNGAGFITNAVSGVLTATSFIGNGSGITGIVTNLVAGDNISLNNSTGTVTITGLAKTDRINAESLVVSGVATFSSNVTIGGTLTYEDVTNIDSVGLITARNGINVSSNGINVTGVSTFQSNVHFGDNDQIILGDGPDLKIYHDGSNSYVEDTGVGALIMKGSTLRFRSTTNEKIINAHQNGSVDLFYDNVKKFETTASGIDITGHTETDTLNVSGVSTFTGKANFGLVSIGNTVSIGDTLYSDDIRVGGDLRLNATGSQFFAFNEDTVKVKFANWYSSNDHQYGMGMLYYETFFAATEDTDSGNDRKRRFGWYLEKPDNGAPDSDGSATTQGQNDRMHLDRNGLFIRNNLEVNTNLNVTGITTLSGNVNLSGDITSNVTIVSTDAGSSAAPELKLYRNSASPADADYLGQIKFAGESDTGVERNYAKITGKIKDASNGTEDGIIEIAHIKDGSQNISGRWNSETLQLINGTNLSVAGTLDVTGTTTLGVVTSVTSIQATTYYGDGSKLTGISAGAGGTENVSSNTTISGIVTASEQFYPPTLTTSERDALTVTQGALIFNTTENKVQMYLGSEWKSLAFELDTYTSIGI